MVIIIRSNRHLKILKLCVKRQCSTFQPPTTLAVRARSVYTNFPPQTLGMWKYLNAHIYIFDIHVQYMYVCISCMYMQLAYFSFTHLYILCTLHIHIVFYKYNIQRVPWSMTDHQLYWLTRRRKRLINAIKEFGVFFHFTNNN